MTAPIADRRRVFCRDGKVDDDTSFCEPSYGTRKIETIDSVRVIILFTLGKLRIPFLVKVTRLISKVLALFSYFMTIGIFNSIIMIHRFRTRKGREYHETNVERQKEVFEFYYYLICWMIFYLKCGSNLN